jgi:hypothetical protein
MFKTQKKSRRDMLTKLNKIQIAKNKTKLNVQDLTKEIPKGYVDNKNIITRPENTNRIRWYYIS